MKPGARFVAAKLKELAAPVPVRFKRLVRLALQLAMSLHLLF
jgi:hypothetical protein